MTFPQKLAAPDSLWSEILSFQTVLLFPLLWAVHHRHHHPLFIYSLSRCYLGWLSKQPYETGAIIILQLERRGTKRQSNLPRLPHEEEVDLGFKAKSSLSRVFTASWEMLHSPCHRLQIWLMHQGQVQIPPSSRSTFSEHLAFLSPFPFAILSFSLSVSCPVMLIFVYDFWPVSLLKSGIKLWLLYLL